MSSKQTNTQKSSVSDVIDFLDLLMSTRDMTEDEAKSELKKMGFDIQETEEHLEIMFKDLMEKAARIGSYVKDP